MGFSSELCSPQGHGAVQQMQEAELRLLEGMRKWMAQRVKSDREYAGLLHHMSLQDCGAQSRGGLNSPLSQVGFSGAWGLLTPFPPSPQEFLEVLGISVCPFLSRRAPPREGWRLGRPGPGVPLPCLTRPVLQSWAEVTSQTEGLSRLLRQHAEDLNSGPLSKLSLLIGVRQQLRKTYGEQWQQLQQELTKVGGRPGPSPGPFCLHFELKGLVLYKSPWIHGKVEVLTAGLFPEASLRTFSGWRAAGPPCAFSVALLCAWASGRVVQL